MRAIKTLITHHPNLRLSITDTLDTPSRLGYLIQDTDSLQVCSLVGDASSSQTPENSRKVEEVRDIDYSMLVSTELDLSEQPYHCVLYKLSSREAVIVFRFHHIVMDGTSLYIVSRDLLKLLRGESLGPGVDAGCLRESTKCIAPNIDSYSAGSDSRTQKKLAKWISLLSSARECTFFPNIGTHNFISECVYLPIPPSTSTSLTSLTQLTKVSSVVVFSAMFVCALAKFTTLTDIIIGMVSANRGREAKDTVNYFVNTLPLRVDFSNETHAKTIPDLLKHVKRNWSMVLDGALDLADLLPHVDCLKHRGQSAISESPLQVLFSYYNVTEGKTLPTEISLGGVEMTCQIHSPKPGHTHTDLVLEVDPTKHSPTGDQLFTWEFRKSALTRSQVKSLHTLVCDFIEAACEACSNGSASLSPLSLVPGASGDISSQRLSILNGHAQVNLESLGPDGEPLCYIERFSSTVQTSPEAPVFALPSEDTLSYKQANILATKIALLLMSKGAQPGDHIGIHMTRSHWLYLTILAILKCSCAYVPIDTNSSQERGEKILRLANVKVLIVESELRDHFSLYEGGIVEFNDMVYTLLLQGLDHDHSGALTEFSDLGITYSPGQVCYILFTSGTTGEPKGVAIAERNLHTTLDNLQTLFSPEETRLALAAANVSFDGHITDALFPMVNRSCLVVTDSVLDLSNPDKTESMPALSKITFAFATPSSASVVTFPETMRALKVGGEVFSRACFNNTLQIPKVVNGYGPTETTTFVSTNHLPRQHEISKSLSDEDIASIGTPVPNCKLMVLDESKQAVPIGTPGVLHVAGPNVSEVGYYGRPDLTRKVFFTLRSCDIVPESRDQHSISEHGDEEVGMVYCTGDLVKVLSNGKLQFLGRADDQVKLRGIRFHLLEVEQALSMCECVTMCVVFVKNHGTPAAQLVACVTPGGVDTSRVKESVAKSVPKYMVPSIIMAMDEFPLTITGKVDKKKLETSFGSMNDVMELDARASTDSKQPNTLPNADVPSKTVFPEGQVKSLSLILSRIFAQVLGVDSIDPVDDFFKSGGHSLLTFQLLREVNRQTEASLNLTHILQHTTPAELATVILTQQKQAADLEGIFTVDQKTSVQDGEAVVENVSSEFISQSTSLKMMAPSVDNSESLQLTTPSQSEEPPLVTFDYLKPVPDVPLPELLRRQLIQLFQTRPMHPQSDLSAKLPSDVPLDLKEIAHKLEIASGVVIPASSLVHYHSLSMLQSHYKLKTILSFKTQPNQSSVVVLQPPKTPEETPLFFIHAGIIGWALPYHRLAQDLGVYSVAIQYTSSAPQLDFEQKALFYLEQIKSVQKKGPYKLIGVCYGALLVYEITRQLSGLGERVALALLINNSPLPENLPTLFSPGGEIPLQGTVLHPYTFFEASLGLNFSRVQHLSQFTKLGVKCEELAKCLLSVYPWLPFTSDELVSAYLQFFLPVKSIWSGEYSPRPLIGRNVGSVVLVRDRNHPLFKSHDYGLLRLVDQELFSVVVPSRDLGMLSDKTTRDCIASIIKLFL